MIGLRGDNGILIILSAEPWQNYVLIHLLNFSLVTSFLNEKHILELVILMKRKNINCFFPIRLSNRPSHINQDHVLFLRILRDSYFHMVPALLALIIHIP